MKGIKLIQEKKLATKTTFVVEFERTKTNFIGKEVFNNGTTKYYPFYEKDGKIEKKYKSIHCITIDKGVLLKSGVSFTESKGFGFTNPKGVSNLFYYFQDKFPNVNELVISKTATSKIDGNKFILNFDDFVRLEEQTGNFVENKKNESQNLYQLILHKVIPSEIDPPNKPEYVKGSLKLFIEQYNNVNFSDEETKDLTNLLINSGLPQVSTSPN